MRLEQAVFTSIRGERLEGYQLAARSPGIDEELAKELTAWGPAHDSLWSDEGSINFHPLAGGRHGLSRTTLAGSEYSGRGGGRVYTQTIVLTAEGLAAFANDPLLVLRAIAASGRLLVYDQLPAQLPTIPLLGRGREIARRWREEVVERVGREPFAELVETLASGGSATVATDLPSERLFQVVLWELAPAQRLAVSFTTGLRPSSRRPFRLATVPDDPALARQSQRIQSGKVITLSRGVSEGGRALDNLTCAEFETVP
ncbi:MAG: hypothetical protein SFU86_21565 [Pirellulaceae bacterium]|nr:hypothetical protein [Pirellulaceae bacterium]